MANTVVNENIIKPAADGAQKFVDLKGLDYFWSKAQKYVDDADKVTADKVAALEGVVGDDTKGLVKEVAALRVEVDALGGGEGGIQGMIDATIAELDLPNTYDAKGDAAQALVDAKAYTDGKVDGKFDAKGDADAALEAAKKYTDDELVAKVGVYASEGVEASGLRKEIAERDAAVLAAAQTYTDGKDAEMSGRVAKLEAIDHDKLAADAAADAVATVVATVVDSAPEAFDTLKEIADWIQKDAANENGFDAAARIVALESGKADKTYVDGLDKAMDTRVKVLEGINHDAYIAADTELKSELSGAIATAKSEAIADAEGKVNTMASTLRGEIATAKSEAVSEAKTYADSVAATAESNAKADTAEKLKSYSTITAMEAAIATAKSEAISAAQGKIDSLTQTVADNLVTAKGYADGAETAAKVYAETYTDALFASITFATNTEIDSIF